MHLEAFRVVREMQGDWSAALRRPLNASQDLVNFEEAFRHFRPRLMQISDEYCLFLYCEEMRLAMLVNLY